MGKDSEIRAIASSLMSTDYNSVQVNNCIYPLNSTRELISYTYNNEHKSGICEICKEHEFDGWCKWENCLKGAEILYNFAHQH